MKRKVILPNIINEKKNHNMERKVELKVPIHHTN